VKRVGSCVYVHSSNTGCLPADELADALRVAGNVSYTYVKWDTRTGAFTFVRCRGWDTLPEPICEAAVRVHNGRVKPVSMGVDNSLIIHGKHLFVGPDYTGFDVAEARARWESYQGASWLDKRRMGRLAWWRQHALPRLRRQDG